MTDFQIHQTFIELADRKALPSQLMQKLLDKKHHRAIKLFERAKNSATLETLWNQAKEQGDLAAAYWALVTQKRVSVDLIHSAQGELHMLAHSFHSSRQCWRKTHQALKREISGLKKRLVDTQAGYQRRLQEAINETKVWRDRLAREIKANKDLAMDVIERFKFRFNGISLAELEQETGVMIRRYRNQPHKFLAIAVSDNLIGLLAHPDFTACAQTRCAYRGLASQWRIIAGL